MSDWGLLLDCESGLNEWTGERPSLLGERFEMTGRTPVPLFCVDRQRRVPHCFGIHFPMQKPAKMRPMTSSGVTFPVMAPMASRASRRSCAISSASTR